MTDIATSIQQRIAGIDQRIAQLADAKTSLERALAELHQAASAVADGPVKTTARRPAAAPPKRAAARGRRPAAGATRKRAPAGRNRQVIVEYLQDSGPALASQIARETGVNRAVVYTNLTQMGEEGVVHQGSGDDGKTVFSLSR